MRKPKSRKTRSDSLGPRRQISVRVQEDVARTLEWKAMLQGKTLTWLCTHELTRLSECALGEEEE